MAARLMCSAILIGSVLGAGSVGAAPKTDVVQLFNGDRLTGEIKELRQGILKLKTDNAGTINIEWDKIVQLKTLQRLQVKLTSGVLRFGAAPAFGPSGMLRLDQGLEREPLDVPLTDIVVIYTIDQGRLAERLDGYLTAGYSYTKSNALQEFNFTGGVNATLERRSWSLDSSMTLTTQTGRENTQRADISGVYRWALEDRWFWQAMAIGERNEELGLTARGSVGGGIGRYLVQDPHHEWSVYAALLGTSEKPEDGSEQQNLVSVLGTQYVFFQYDTPERTVSGKLEALPSLTESGRIRGDASLVSRWEIVKDFIFEVSIDAAYDSSPGAGAKSHTDYGMVTSLGFTW